MPRPGPPDPAGSVPAPFLPPEYPYDRLGELREEARSRYGEVVDFSIGTPCDPAPRAVVEAMSSPLELAGYPASRGSTRYLEACTRWLERRFGVEIGSGLAAACVGTKELVASLPHFLRLRRPELDTVLYPEVSYPTYAMGAQLAGCRAIPVPVTGDWRLDLGAIDHRDASRALLLWVNSPGNPAGQLDDLGAAAAWGRERSVPVASDECYAEFTFSDDPRSILESGTDGVLAVHSLSKRSNLAGLRAGFYAGDPELVTYLSLLRMHAGLMVPGPVQEAAVCAWDDDHHATRQREVYRARLERLAGILSAAGAEATPPEGGIYIWARCPPDRADSWDFARFLVETGGALVSPGDLYGPAGRGHVRVAAVQPDERIETVARRLGA